MLVIHENANVVSQDCGLVQGILCGVEVGATAAACTAICLGYGPGPCVVCVAAALGSAYEFCIDCLPAWIRAIMDLFESGGGGGGGGGGPLNDCTMTGCPRDWSAATAEHRPSAPPRRAAKGTVYTAGALNDRMRHVRRHVYGQHRRRLEARAEGKQLDLKLRYRR
jgi:hypothetical protein